MPRGPISFRLDEAAGVQPVVLLFAPSERSPAYENQMTLLGEGSTLEQLNAVLVQAFAEGNGYVRSERLDEASQDELRTAYDVGEDDFLIVFVARDGSEVHRSDAPVQPSVILDRFSGGMGREEGGFAV